MHTACIKQKQIYSTINAPACFLPVLTFEEIHSLWKKHFMQPNHSLPYWHFKIWLHYMSQHHQHWPGITNQFQRSILIFWSEVKKCPDSSGLEKHNSLIMSFFQAKKRECGPIQPRKYLVHRQEGLEVQCDLSTPPSLHSVKRLVSKIVLNQAKHRHVRGYSASQIPVFAICFASFALGNVRQKSQA